MGRKTGWERLQSHWLCLCHPGSFSLAGMRIIFPTTAHIYTPIPLLDLLVSVVFKEDIAMCFFPGSAASGGVLLTLLCPVWFGLHLSSVGLQCVDHISADLSSLVLGMSCIRAAPVSSGSPELSRDKDGSV